MNAENIKIDTIQDCAARKGARRCAVFVHRSLET